MSIATDIKIIDTDSHIMEPPDLWTSRLDDDRWGNLIPHVERDERRDEDRWHIGTRRVGGVATFAMAGWNEFPPSHPPRVEDADPAAWDPTHRLQRLDEYGIYAQLLYPNLLGFSSRFFFEMEDHDLRNACVRAYNDFLIDFASEDPSRLIPLMWLPFWDIEESLREMRRCEARGHHGIIFPANFEPIGLPLLPDAHWDPFWDAAQSLELSINFHTGFQATIEEARSTIGFQASRSDYAKGSCMFMIGNARMVADLTLYGMCHRFPRLNFVSVESGFGWMPYFAEVLDWQWLNSGAKDAYTDIKELPSEFMKRQIYGSFWFEKDSIIKMIDDWQDTVFFESDFPHPTSLSPGPASYSEIPSVTVEQNLASIDRSILEKILHANAARVYHIG
ncbi:MAG TPA: amidohydrolase family protein [Acidimicrobiales bacterium]|nr:amidohydrolase family protein [Acidimicrobiales bacterium]